MTEEWLVLSIVTLVIWGMWGFLGKIASSHLNYKEVYLIAGIGSTAVLLVFYSIFKPSLQFGKPGFYYALAAGLTSIGGLLYYLALSKGKASLVVPLTALYPLVTVALSLLILKEKVTLFQGIGILLALISIVFMSL